MDKYARAQLKITSGDWSVEPDRGLVVNKRGKLLGSRTSYGYTFLSMSPAPGGRSNQNVYAHRVIWESQHGTIPVGLQINHRNGNKQDNRIDNLELVTPSGNIQHAVDTGLLVQATGEDAHRAKITQQTAEQILVRAAQGETQQSIADDVGICRQQVSRIVRGERWRVALAR